MLNKSDNEIYIMAPGEGNVLDYIVLNKAFNLEDLDEPCDGVRRRGRGR